MILDVDLECGVCLRVSVVRQSLSTRLVCVHDSFIAVNLTYDRFPAYAME